MASAAKAVVQTAGKVAAEATKEGAKRLYNKVYFPNTIIEMKNSIAMLEKKEPHEVVKLKVSPKLTRIEVKNYVETMYDTAVKKVNTVNYEGKIKRVPASKAYYKRPDFKVAYVYLENSWSPEPPQRNRKE